nr:cysteine dioxygenase family protein [Motilibacter deserti]
MAVSDDIAWRRTVRFDPAERWFTRVAATSSYEAWLLSWLPGQGTGPHDHGGSAGAFLVLQGELEEAGYATTPGRSTATATRRLGTGSVRRFGAQHVHDVRAVGDVPAVSLHVYAPALTRMTRYAWDGDRLVVRATEAAGADW